MSGSGNVQPDEVSSMLTEEYLDSLGDMALVGARPPWERRGKPPHEFISDMEKARIARMLDAQDVLNAAIERTFEFAYRKMTEPRGLAQKARGALFARLEAETFLEFGEHYMLMKRAAGVLEELRRNGIDLAPLAAASSEQRQELSTLLSSAWRAVKRGTSLAALCEVPPEKESAFWRGTVWTAQLAADGAEFEVPLALERNRRPIAWSLFETVCELVAQGKRVMLETVERRHKTDTIDLDKGVGQT